MPDKSSAKTALKVSGMMSEQGADNVGNKLSNAVLILSASSVLGVLLFGTAALIKALH